MTWSRLPLIGRLVAAIGCAVTGVSAFAAMPGCGSVGQIACVPSTETRWLLEDLLAGAGPSELKRRTPAPARTNVTYTVEGRTRSGDLYIPAGAARAGLVLVPGATTAGKDDARLVAFANSLARSGFAVLVPDLAEVKHLRLRPEDAQDVADAFVHLVSRPELAPGGRAGIAGVSYALGPGLLAAMEPRVRDRVRFVLGIGGYYDLTEVVTFFLTGYYTDPEGVRREAAPSLYGKWAFIRANARRFASPDEQAVLEELADRRYQTPEADVSDLTARLRSPEARAFLALLENRDPERVPTLLAALPPAVRADLEGLDLARRGLGDLEARLILVHGYDDPLVPWPQSVTLSRQARNARLYLVNGLNHVDFQQPGAFDAWSLGCATNALLAEQTR